MERFILYIGLNDKDTKKQEINFNTAVDIVTREVARTCGGGTILAADGVYQHTDGTIVYEKSLKVEILFSTETAVRVCALELKKALNQESIAIQRDVIEYGLI